MRLTLLVLLLLCAAAVSADAIVRTQAMLASTIAEVYVEEAHVRLELEVGLDQLEAFRNLLPDEIYAQMGFGDEPFAARLQRFFDEQFVIVADDTMLAGRLIRIGPTERVRRDDITGEPLAGGDEPETVVNAVFAWPLETRPQTMNFLFSAPGASVGFIVYHEGVAVNDFRYMAGAQQLNLDWDDPWYSSFDNRSLRRQYYAPMAGFIYVEPYEVRKEIIVRPKDLQRWVDLGLEGRDTIPVELHADILQKATTFLAGRQPVTIDGNPARHSLARANFLERTLRTSRVIDPPEELDINAAILGVIFVYAHEAFADSVTMEWDMFDERVQIVPVAGVDPAGPLPQFLEPDFATLEWTNFIRVPVMPQLADVSAPPGVLAGLLYYGRWVLAALSIVVVALWLQAMAGGTGRRVALGVSGAALFAIAVGGWWLGDTGRLDETATREVTQGLLTNIYRAFDFRDESDVYDVLARSVDGDLLRQVYLEMRRGLVLASQGGASARVKDVELVALEPESGEGQSVQAKATWQVRAAVGHWGHVHERRNQYQANLRLQPIDGAWKLVAVEILDEERL